MSSLLGEQSKLVQRQVDFSRDSELRSHWLRTPTLILFANRAFEFSSLRWRQIVDVRPFPVGVKAGLRGGAHFWIGMELRYGEVFDVLLAFFAGCVRVMAKSVR